MEIYREMILKMEKIKKSLRGCNINPNNINYCLVKLNALSKDLDIINFYITDLEATAAVAVNTRTNGESTRQQ